jgi:AraC family transcriptional regulator
MCSPAMGVTRELFRGEGFSVVEHVCSLGPADKPFEERHGASNVAFVIGGAFAVRSPAGSAALGPGSILLGNEGDPYTCAHDAGLGDVCVSFGYSQEVLAEAGSSLGTRPRFRGISLGPAPAFAAVPAIARASPPALEEAALDVLGRILAADAGTVRLQRPRPADERRAVEALRLIDAHAGEPLSLAMLAGRARLTRFISCAPSGPRWAQRRTSRSSPPGCGGRRSSSSRRACPSPRWLSRWDSATCPTSSVPSGGPRAAPPALSGTDC